MLPQVEAAGAAGPRALPPTRPPGPKVTNAFKVAVVRSHSKHLKGVPPGKAAIVTASGIKYLDRADYVPEVAPPKPKRPRRPAPKHDPKTLAAARELRDRYLEQINAGCVVSQGKYDVSRGLPDKSADTPTPVLPAPLAA